MGRIFKNAAFGFLAIGVLGFLYSTYLLTHRVEINKKTQLSSLLSSVEKPLQLDLPVKSAGCKVNGSLPDHGCTPGAVLTDATKEKICVEGYSATVRNVSASLKKKVYKEYGIAYPPAYGTYEADHLIPLSLGGSNDIANLFPEAADPYPGFKEKDVVENYLHEQVCAGRVALSVAQEQIASNWLVIYNNLDPNTVQQLKNKYKSWVN